MVCAQIWTSRETPEDALILVSECRHIGIQSEHCSAVGWTCADELFVAVRHLAAHRTKMSNVLTPVAASEYISVIMGMVYPIPVVLN